MGRDVGRHTNGDTTGAIDQHIGITGRENGGFFVFAVIIVLEIDRVFINVGQQICSRFVHADFGIAHCGGVIAVHGAKVPLTIE